MELLNHRTFYDMVLSGAHEVIFHQKELNAINVFPVADGDTGNNLAHLMGMITRDCKWGDSSQETLERIKLACMRGSRGNSGMIFSQFIITMCNFLLRYPELKNEQFLEMCDLSVQSAVKSVAAPQEGTVLTVMQTWVRVMKEASKNTESIQLVLKQSFAEVNVALEHTKNQLEEAPHTMTENEEIPYRYCSEFLFELAAADPIILKARLTQLGDSLVMVSDSGLGKVHIHTNNPAGVAEIFAEKGNLLYQKVEDMHRQYQGIYQRKSPIANAFFTFRN